MCGLCIGNPCTGPGRWAQRLDGRAPPAMCMATHRQPTADEQPGWQGVRNKHHKSKPASISGNNHGLVCTNETESMSVCIRIKGFEGKWWQGKTMFCIQNKRNPCFRWQRLAVLCIRFFQNKESGCKDQESKARSCIPKHKKQGLWWQFNYSSLESN